MRYIGTGRIPPRSAIEFDLILGPTMPQNGVEEYSVEQLELAWNAYGREVMDDWLSTRHFRPGSRPRCFWLFQVGAEPEGEEERILFLAERGELTDRELEMLAERQRYWHINEERWCTDPAAVELYERVLAAMAAGSDPIPS